MADKLDFLIRDYITGRLAANIEAGKIQAKYPPKSDNLGIRKSGVNNISPQEDYILRLENRGLKKMMEQKELLDTLWPSEDAFAKQALQIYHIKKLTWGGVALEMNSNRQTIWERVDQLKARLGNWIDF